MKQMSLGESGFERKSKRTRKREFLDEMELVVPWAELLPYPGRAFYVFSIFFKEQK